MRLEDFFIIEASYTGNIGAMEVFKFYKKASKEEKTRFDDLLLNKEYDEAWELVQQVTGVSLQPMGK